MLMTSVDRGGDPFWNPGYLTFLGGDFRLLSPVKIGRLAVLPQKLLDVPSPQSQLAVVVFRWRFESGLPPVEELVGVVDTR